MPFDLSTNLFVSQIAIVAFIAVIITIYPWFKIKRMNIIDALRK